MTAYMNGLVFAMDKTFGASKVCSEIFRPISATGDCVSRYRVLGFLNAAIRLDMLQLA